MVKGDVEIFGLASLEDYLEIADRAVQEFAENRTDVLRCITAILILNHIPDWLDGKLTGHQRVELGWAFGDKKPAKDHFEPAYPDITVVRSVANGVKHLRIKEETRSISGYGQGGYGVGPYGKPYLVIDLGEEKSGMDRWVVADDLAQRVLSWWKRRLAVAF